MFVETKAQPGLELINQIFMLEYCGVNDTKFWSWCKDPSFQPYETKCKKIKLSAEDQSCMGKVHFTKKTHLDYMETCQLGGSPDKAVTEKFEQDFPEARFNEVVSYCKNRGNLPWWVGAILALILLAILCGSFFLFWKYFLRGRMSTKDRRDHPSLTSRLSSATTSSVTTAPDMPSLYTVAPVASPKIKPNRSVSFSRSKKVAKGGGITRTPSSASGHIPQPSRLKPESSSPPDVANEKSPTPGG